MPKIILKNFQKGLSSSPYVKDGAYSRAVAIDIDHRKGLIESNHIMVNGTYLKGETPTSITTYVNWIIFDDVNSDYYALSSGNKVWKSESGTEWLDISDDSQSAGVANGAAVWKNYLFVAGDEHLDIYGVLSGSPSWTLDWDTNALTSATWHSMLVSKNDDKLYICNGENIAVLEEVAGQDFDPANGDTYTFTADALPLPEGYKARCLAEKREDILIGTDKGTYSKYIPDATIFVWDREKSEYDFPVSVDELGGIQSMKNIGGTINVVAGLEGKLYQFTEASLRFIGQIPIVRTSGSNWFEVRPGAMTFHEGKLLIGTLTHVGHPNPMGIYSFKDGRFNHEKLVSSGGTGATNTVGYSALYASDVLIAGRRDNTVYGIDTNWGIDRMVDYGSYFESLFYRVGTFRKKYNPEPLQIELAKVLLTGQAVRIRYRNVFNPTLGTGWTTYNTFSYTTHGAKKSFMFPPIPPCENLQLEIAFDSAASNNYSPQILEIRC